MKALERGIVAAAVGAALMTLAGASLGASQLFKCIDGGRTVYQQQACPVSSQPEPAASAAGLTAKTNTNAAAEPASAPARKLRPPAPASAALATSP
jgi:hypothetical protein